MLLYLLNRFHLKGDVTREKAQYVRVDTGLCFGIDDWWLMANLASDKIFKTELEAHGL